MKRGQLAAVLVIVAVVALVGALVLFGMPKAVGPGKAILGSNDFSSSYTGTEGLDAGTTETGIDSGTQDPMSDERLFPQEGRPTPTPTPQGKKYLDCSAKIKCGTASAKCTVKEGDKEVTHTVGTGVDWWVTYQICGCPEAPPNKKWEVWDDACDKNKPSKIDDEQFNKALEEAKSDLERRAKAENKCGPDNQKIDNIIYPKKEDCVVVGVHDVEKESDTCKKPCE